MARLTLNVLQLAGLLPMVAGAYHNGHHKSTSLDSSTNLCSTIQYQFPTLVSIQGDAAYNASQSSFYTSLERDVTPGCVFRPNCTADVSKFIKLISSNTPRTRSGDFSGTFAVRGGGHTLWTGAANIDGGVTVDMRGMNSFSLSKDLKTASLGGGAIWSDIYPQLTPHNLTIMGGRLPGIGVGGFATGGGLSFMARRHGWTVDNIYGYEVVLASGEVVYASASSNSDLWLALKGGSNNFGIITRFDVATFPSTQMLGGIVAYNYTQSNVEAHAQAFSNLMLPQNFDDAAMLSIIIGYQNPGGFSLTDSLFYVDPVTNPPVYEPFLAIPALENTLTLNTVDGIVSSFGKVLPATLERAVELVYSFKNSNASVYMELIQIWEGLVTPLNDIEGLDVQFLIQPHAVSNGTNSMGLTAGEKDLVMVDMTIAYTNAADDATVQTAIQNIVNQQKSYLSKQGLLIPFVYLNYADKSQDPISSYGSAQKAKLQATSKKYDPKGLFQTANPGGFKLF
ncbi:hypothetical protein V8C35DRAFT_299670 [Trichoderma chlorosporum]